MHVYNILCTFAFMWQYQNVLSIQTCLLIVLQELCALYRPTQWS